MQYLKGLLILTLIASSLLSMAQDDQIMPNVNERPVASASQTETPPVIDGDVINDVVWNSISPFEGLVQTRPNAGQPVSERTEVRITQTATTFYLSVICYDKNPELLVVSDMRRDASLDDTDAVLFILDTYHDGQNGFVFGTNSLGVEYDAQVDNEGQGNFNSNRQQGGMIGGFNLNWDAVWEVKTEVGDYGWSAEFAIPLRTLRFNSGDNITWGFNFQRIIRKRNEVAFWAPLPIQFDLKRLSLAGDLQSLELKKPGNLKLIPYALGRVTSDYQVDPTETNVGGDVGVDIKYSITPAVTLDLTYNTDFAQVEVDDQQVNLDRFNLFFPEKRPFFLENAGLFGIGSPGEVDLFFSRRIGIGDDGLQVPIIGGARLSGRIDKTNIGVLSMFTDEVEEEGIIKNNFTVARVNHQYGSRSSIGVGYIARDGIGIEDNYNRVFAADTRVGIGKKAQISGFVAKSSTPGIEDSELAFKAQAQYEWNGLNLNLAYTEVEEGFNPEVGFLNRTSFSKPEFLIFKQVRLKENKLGMLELRPHISHRSYWDITNRDDAGFERFRTTRFTHIDNHWEWKNGFEVHTGINLTSEGVISDFEISDGVVVPASTYDHSEAQIIFLTNSSKNVWISTRHILGGFFGGSRRANSGTLGIRVGDKFNTTLTLRHNDIKLEGGEFTTTVFGGRVSYSFSPRINLQSLIQYNSVSGLWLSNIRFSILREANSGLFAVFNDVRGGGMPVNRSFTIKYSHVIDVLR